MNPDLQNELLRELVDLQAAKQPFLDETWLKVGMEKYFDPEHFARERASLFRAQPRIALHSSELPEAGAYQTLEMAGRPMLVVRGDDQQVRAFYNVCRHRGAQLVGEDHGCNRRFSCPYHAWTWNNQGELVGVPHQQTGFPDLDRATLGLRQVPCQEYGGWIWLAQEGELDVAAHLGPLADEVAALGGQDMTVFQTDSWEFDANWKLIVEGGLEAYHFRVAHRDTIAPLFLDNLSSYRSFGRHIRSVLPRSNLDELRTLNEAAWSLGDYANVIYTIFPTTQFLVQSDHIAWIQLEPLAADRTRLRLSTVVPAAMREERCSYWQRNHDLTVRTLKEDFAIGEGIQRGFATGANEQLNYGRFEGALARFNAAVSSALQD